MKSPLGQTRWRLSLATLILCTILWSSCVPFNNYPVISSLEAEKDWVMPSGSCKVECVAYDADGDSLTYTWSATGGTFSGAGPVATWLAPHIPGTYTITVKVTDGRGGEATTQLTINLVAINHPPVIHSLATKWQRVRKAVSSTVECVALDPDGDDLRYIWSVDGGNISGEGAVVTWVAPNAYGTYTITVTVIDVRGDEASKSISIEVCSCPGAAS